MLIWLNGESKMIDQGSSAQKLIQTLGLAEKRLAVEVNGEIVSRSQYAQHTLKEGDRIEIVHAVGGG